MLQSLQLLKWQEDCGGNMFGLLKKRVTAEQLAKSLARYAIGIDSCAAMVSMMRDLRVSDEVAVSECAFLRASYLKGLLSEHCSGNVLKRMTDIVDKEVIDAFTGKERYSSKEASAYYQNRKMSDIAKERLGAYEELGNALEKTCPSFCTRVGAQNIVMNIEIQAMLNDLLGSAIRKSLKSVKPV
jgi:hypothetical protein